ncbi:hypothetical protein D3C74_397190 [compost metagenome]
MIHLLVEPGIVPLKVIHVPDNRANRIGVGNILKIKSEFLLNGEPCIFQDVRIRLDNLRKDEINGFLNHFILTRKVGIHCAFTRAQFSRQILCGKPRAFGSKAF